MTIDLDKILTISATEYTKRPSDYNYVGVHASGVVDHDSSPSDSPKRYLAKKVPIMAEAVVGYRVNLAQQYGNSRVFYEANGTALIPKKK